MRVRTPVLLPVDARGFVSVLLPDEAPVLAIAEVCAGHVLQEGGGFVARLQLTVTARSHFVRLATLLTWPGGERGAVDEHSWHPGDELHELQDPATTSSAPWTPYWATYRRAPPQTGGWYVDPAVASRWARTSSSRRRAASVITRSASAARSCAVRAWCHRAEDDGRRDREKDRSARSRNLTDKSSGVP